MTGMGHGLSTNNPLVLAAFHSALRWQGLLVGLLCLLAFGAWLAARALRAPVEGTPAAVDTDEEPAGRRLLRVGFGLVWILDGLLQAQPAMPLGMPAQVVQPAAAASPLWVQHLVNDGLAVWLRHPVPAAVSAVWIQVGIGLLLLLAPRGTASRLAGLAAAGWGLVVWAFGEAFGGIFAPGLSWMFGAPGAVLIYVVAGFAVAAPERAWAGQRAGRVILGGTGAFFVAMAVLQAWPGRGFWQGQPTATATPGAVTAMVQSMSQVAQPSATASTASWFATVSANHGWAVNLVAVLALGLLGAGLIASAVRYRPRLAQATMSVAVVVCLADWLLVQDLGFFGGVGTDPNSMVPWLLLIGAGFLACARPAPAEAAAPAPATLRALTVRRLGVVAAAGAVGVLLVGVAPMALASVNGHTDSLLTEALNGSPDVTRFPAPTFTLTDQQGRTVSLAGLRGHTVVLTFLDPVCTTDCPTIAQNMRQVDQAVGQPSRTVFVAVAANPIYHDQAVLRAFDAQEGLNTLSNWLFLTGSPAQLSRVWAHYGIEVETVGAGGMVAHTDNAYVIDSSGQVRYQVGTDPGTTSTTAESFVTLLTQQVRSVLAP